MRVVEQVYDFSKYALKNRHMFLFLFPTKYRYEDSFCRCFRGKKRYELCRHLYTDSEER